MTTNTELMAKDLSGFRIAKGNKFETVLDSYMYALALYGTRYDEFTDMSGSWATILVSDDFVADLEGLAHLHDLRITNLGLTAIEVGELNSTAVAVIFETPEGLVEVNYHFSLEDGIQLFDEAQQDGIRVMKVTSNRLKTKKAPKVKAKVTKARLSRNEVDSIMARVDASMADVRNKESAKRKKKIEGLTTPAHQQVLGQEFEDSFPRSNYD